jgi:hypothetical protein
MASVSTTIDAHIAEYLEDPCLNPPLPISRYLDGCCDIFAAAASELIGWKVYGIMENRIISTDKGLVQGDGLIHAFCINPHNPGEIFDAKGYRPIEHMRREYPIPADSWYESYETGLVIVDAIRRTVQPIEKSRLEVDDAKKFILKYYSLRGKT